MPDPHGDLIDRICGIIPSERIDDVVSVDPSDEEYSIGFNILSAHSEHEKTLVPPIWFPSFNGFRPAWGDQMNSVLQNAILAFLESSRGGTLADLRRFLIEPPFGQDFLQIGLRSRTYVYYWQKGFPSLIAATNPSVPILTRLEMFLGRKPHRPHGVAAGEQT